MLEILPQLVANGFIAGAFYALVATGFSLIYSTNRFVHFAHGAVMIFGAYTFYVSLGLLNLPLIISIFFAILFAIIIGWLCFFLVYLPLQNRKASNAVLLLASIGLLILLENLLLLIFGADGKIIDYLIIAKGVSFLGVVITPLQLVTIATSFVLMIILFWFINKNRYGKTMRAVANNPELSATIGIPIRKFQHLSFVIGSALAGVAGILIALERNIEPLMGVGFMIRGFTGAVVGGMNSIVGSVIGSFIVGLSENLGVAFVSSGYKDAIAFVVLFVFLIFRPQGLFGVKKGTRDE
jgi:branched-subunit amino acid ABC-type transport system permease component